MYSFEYKLSCYNIEKDKIKELCFSAVFPVGVSFLTCLSRVLA